METQWFIYGYSSVDASDSGPDDPGGNGDGGTGSGGGSTQVEADALDWTDGFVLVPSID